MTSRVFLLLLAMFFILGLMAQAGGCGSGAGGGGFRTYRGNGLVVPYSQYTDGQTCREPWLYMVNVVWQALLAFIGTYLIGMDEAERKKRTQWIKKEAVLETRVGLNSLKLNLLITPIAFVAVVVAYILVRNNISEYGFWIILGPMLVSLAITLVILIPKRNNPNYHIYYLFHPTRFIKIGIASGVLFALILYFIGQCGASYGLSIGAECINNLFSTPSSFFGN